MKIDLNQCLNLGKTREMELNCRGSNWPKTGIFAINWSPSKTANLSQ